MKMNLESRLHEALVHGLAISLELTFIVSLMDSSGYKPLSKITFSFR